MKKKKGLFAPKRIAAVCLVGPVTRDEIVTDEGCRSALGGTVYFSGKLLGRLKKTVTIVTRAAQKDRKEFVRVLRGRGLQTTFLPSRRTAVFRHVYRGREKNERREFLLEAGTRFKKGDLKICRSRVLYLAPLVRSDMGFSFFLEACRGVHERVVLDLQGPSRIVVGNTVVKRRWPGFLEKIKGVAVLKASEDEARALTGTGNTIIAGQRLIANGAKEVVITKGPRGVLLFTPKGHRAIPAGKISRAGDPTGCGDVFLAAYVAKRMEGKDPYGACLFASKVAAERAGQKDAEKFFKGTARIKRQRKREKEQKEKPCRR